MSEIPCSNRLTVDHTGAVSEAITDAEGFLCENPAFYLCIVGQGFIHVGISERTLWYKIK